ncbi:farnesol dehydrogenase-like [Lutzomyia longipalpis]|uniref:farnesol dehydrogenase-like n=1 Tax=Lutzomyia longipalpis TaxID=7200 RepID=UPI002483F54D|nr:farnesol dehydrogenase-like [Lutzomyia longipalpis]
MNRWLNRVAVVTGASSGIGAQIAKDLANSGMKVVGLARRVERVKSLGKELPQEVQQHFHPVKCDVMNEEEIIETFSWIKKSLGGIDVLINNAGTGNSRVKLVDAGNSDKIRKTLNTNLMGVFLCAREAYQSMRERSFPGHIININSVLGHGVPVLPKEYGDINLNIYPATKYGVTALTESFRQEFIKEKSDVKITSISPGTVQTEIIPDYSDEILKKIPHLMPADISAAVLYILGTPPNVNVKELIISPTKSFF